MQQRIIVGVGLSGIIAALAYRRDMLTRSGVVGTMFVGTIVFGFGGIPASSVVIFFFVSSSLLSHLESDRKQRVAGDKFSKSGRRDFAQTLANGGVGALAVLGYRMHPRHPNWLLAAFVGAFATATADTWATEVGTLSSVEPRLITSGHKVPPGTSGGLTSVGTAAAAAGALLLSAVAALTTRQGAFQNRRLRHMLIASGLGGGIAGALFDSLLGATVQQVRYCPRCKSETERPMHECGTATVPLRGWAWLNNDVVNLLSTGVGATIAAIIGESWAG